MGSPDAGKRFLELAVSQRCPKDNEPLDFDGVALRGLAVVSAEHGAGYLQSAACTATANTDASALHRDTRSSSSSGIRTGCKLAA